MIKGIVMRVVSEEEFFERMKVVLADKNVGCVTGPGRSGAVAAVYASHMLSVPFVPYGSKMPVSLGKLLIIDTATESGKTLKKAARKYKDHDIVVVAAYHEPPRVMFWYEAPKPQRYKHERPIQN